jgi:hypothetical protein
MGRGQWTFVIVLTASLVAGEEPRRERHRDPLGFSFDLPPGWTVSPSAVPGLSRFHGEGCAPTDQTAVCRELVVVMQATALEGETSEAAYRRRLRPWKAVTEGHIVVDGETVPWRVHDHAGSGPSDPARRLFSVVVVRGWKLYEFTGWSRPESFSKAQTTFQGMVRSLAFP